MQIGTGWGGFDTIIGVGDFTGDKKVDLLARTPSGVLNLYKGTGTGKVISRVKAGSGWNTMIHLTGVGPKPGSKVVVQSGVGDLNSDGRRDVIAREASTGKVWLYRGKTASTWSRVAMPVDWSDVRFAQGMGDFDADGVADVLVVTNDGVVNRYPSNGAGGFGAPVELATGWEIYDQVVNAGDFNGDRGRTSSPATAPGCCGPGRDRVRIRGGGPGRQRLVDVTASARSATATATVPETSSRPIRPERSGSTGATASAAGSPGEDRQRVETWTTCSAPATSPGTATRTS